MSPLRVKDVMNRKPPAVRRGTLLTDVVNLLLQHRLLGLPVVNSEQHVIGFVSEQECIHTLLISSYHSEGAPRVDDVMSTSPSLATPQDSIVDLALRMEQERHKVYPVVSSDRLVGLVTRSGILKALNEARITSEV